MMNRTNQFFNIEVEHDPDDPPEKIGDEICQRLSEMVWRQKCRTLALHDTGGKVAAPAVCSKVRRKKPSVIPAM